MKKSLSKIWISFDFHGIIHKICLFDYRKKFKLFFESDNFLADILLNRIFSTRIYLSTIFTCDKMSCVQRIWMQRIANNAMDGNRKRWARNKNESTVECWTVAHSTCQLYEIEPPQTKWIIYVFWPMQTKTKKNSNRNA